MAGASPLRLVIPGSHAEPASLQRTVLLVVKNPKLVRNVTRVLRASHVDIIQAQPSSVVEWMNKSPPDLIIYDADLLNSDENNVLSTIGQHPTQPGIILLSEEKEAARLADLLEHHAAGNLVAKLGELENGDLLVTARKILENDLFGLEKYLRWGSVVHTYRVSSSRERHSVLAELEQFLDELCCRSRIAGRIVTVADELIMNSLYDAPVDAQGKFLYANTPRTQAVTLPPAQAAEFSFGSDGRFVAIGCRDPFGSLEPSRLRASLARCLRRGPDQISQSTGGAGIGLYMIFQFVNHLVVNVDPGVATEFVGVVDIAANPRETHFQPRSFNVFVKRP